jgi:hypothetical protein
MSPGRIKPFTYITVEKAPLYRAIMRVFVEAKNRFVLQLRPQEIVEGVQASGLSGVPDAAEIESALEQLCDWGNLETRPDMASVAHVEDFYRQRNVFEITEQGDAVEQALAVFAPGASAPSGELPLDAVRDIRELIRELKQLSNEPEADAEGRVRRGFLALGAAFDALVSGSQAFIGALRSRIDLQLTRTDEFVSRTQSLIEHIEQFLAEFVMASTEIAQGMQDIEMCGIERLVPGLAERGQWSRVRNWFIAEAGLPSHADILRDRARSSISILLSVVSTIDDRRLSRIDRSNDFRVLARWFAHAESDGDAHRLWRAVFGLCPARHLIVNEATLDDHELHDVSAGTSWMDAPPLRISRRLRAYGNHSRAGRLSRIIDRTKEKEKLAAATRQERLQLMAAQSRFATGQRLRLSELDHVESDEFDLFLEIIGEAVAASVLEGETSEVLSSDGSLRVRLEATDDGRMAVIRTPEGVLTGPDFWISVEPGSVEEVVL